MTLDSLPPEIRAIVHYLAISAERIEGRPLGRELVVDLNAAAQAICDAVAIRSPQTAPRTADEIRASLTEVTDSNQREAHAESIMALTPEHRFFSAGPATATWTNARGVWQLTLNYRDIGYQPVVTVVMPLMGTMVTVPLPDHSVAYLRAMLVILGAIEPDHD